MKHATTRILFAYWDSLRGERAAPERGEIRPGSMRHVLADAFILANESDTTFRLAGTRICALFGRDLAGASFRGLWQKGDALEIRRVLGMVVDDTAGVLVGALATNVNGSHLPMEMVLLPLRHGGRTDTRMLGALSPATVPSWAGLVPLTKMEIRSLRIIETNLFCEPAGIDALKEHRSQLVVHEGGLA